MTGGNVSVQIVQTIARQEGVSPENLEPRLHDAIDPEALDQLFRTDTDSDGAGIDRVQFDYAGYSVVVESPATIRVSESATDADNSYSEQRRPSSVD